ncbi:alpha/beta fold hydrolase [Streptomyces sp. SDT5-1]|uniref:alpha/beta fold hydrolase n=1 Tax=Streptomyces sp. SDT5-1 TaxID=3406418 RepID=UPI003FD3C4DF
MPSRTRTVVALPGTFCSPVIYERVRHLLAERFDVDAPSWMTDAPDCTLDGVATWVADRVTAAARGPVLLIGHSTGGAIALRLATTRPDLVGGLMLVNTGPHMRGHGDVAALIAGMERDGASGVIGPVLDRSFHTAPTPDDRQRLLDYAHRAPLRAALDVLRSQHTTDLTPDLPALRMPVSVVHGRHDPVRTVDAAESMAAAIPDARLHLLDAGHSPMYETPAEVATAIGELERRMAG